MTKYIEIIGLAGAGKSYCREILVEHGIHRGIVIRHRQPMDFTLSERFRLILSVISLVVSNSALIHWCLARPLHTYARSAHIRGVIRNLKFRAILESIILRKELKHSEHKYVNEEGIVGKIVVLSLLLGRGSEEVASILDVLLPQNTKILMIDISVEKAIKQMTNRGTKLPFWDDLNPMLKEKLYSDCSERYLKICRESFQENGKSYHFISNDTSKKNFKSILISQFDFIVN